jgi:hypothetical protein
MAHELMRHLRGPNERIVFWRPPACMRWRDCQLWAGNLARRANTGQQSCTVSHDDLTLFQAVLLISRHKARGFEGYSMGVACARLRS